MLRFILKRLVGSVIVVWAIMTISFFLMRFAPASPFDAERKLPAAVEANKWLIFGMGEEQVSPVSGTVVEIARVPAPDGGLQPIVEGEEYEAGQLLCTIEVDAAAGVSPVRVALTMDNGGRLVSFPVRLGEHLDVGARVAVTPKPLFEQYLSALGRYAQLDFGKPIASEGALTVSEKIWLGFPVSLELGLWALAIALLLGVAAGLLAGHQQNTWKDYTVMSGAMIGISVPPIVMGPLLTALFVLAAGWLPYGGWDAWDQKILPIATLSLTYVAMFARLTRGGMLEVIRSDYIRTARAKGLDERTIVLRHAFKGAVLPTVSFLGPAVARIITGSIVVERVFRVPGLSEYFVQPALDRDYPMVLGVVVFYSILIVGMNLLVDIAYTLLDPRVSYER